MTEGEIILWRFEFCAHQSILPANTAFTIVVVECAEIAEHACM